MPAGAGFVDTKFVYKTKEENGIFASRKSRLVARGFSQWAGRDYDPKNIFAPVATFEQIRPLLAYAAANKYHVHHVDVDGAFLIPKLDKPVFMESPPDFRNLCGDLIEIPQGEFVIELQKGIYGLKQSARLWADHLKDTLTRLGFTENPRQPCVYTRWEESDSSYSIISTYVDDLVLCVKSEKNLRRLKRKLMEAYSMKDLGNIKWILGTAVQYNQKKGTMNLSQRAYIETVAKKFGFDDLDRTRKYIPMSANDSRIFTKHVELERLKGVKECDATKYRGLVGALLYLSRATRPDIEVAVHMCTCASKRPTVEHMKIAEGILKYCITTNQRSRLGV